MNEESKKGSNPPKDSKDHKDFSTAILDKKKAPNRLMVLYSSFPLNFFLFEFSR